MAMKSNYTTARDTIPRIRPFDHESDGADTGACGLEVWNAKLGKNKLW